MEANNERKRLVDSSGIEYPYSRVPGAPNNILPPGQYYAAPAQLDMAPTGPYYHPDIEAQHTGEWSDGLCSCFSDGLTLLIGCIFFPALIYLTMARLPQSSRIQSAIFGVSILEDPLIATLVFIFAGAISCGIIDTYMVYMLAQTVADKYKIYESVSCCKACFCQPCVLMQLARHTGRAQGFIKYH